MSEEELTKQCSKCKKVLPISEFHRRVEIKKDGYRADCKICCGIRDKEYGLQHRDEKRQYNQQYYQQHKTEFRQYDRQYRSTLQGYLRCLFLGMLKRCNNPKRPEYKNYGARGVKVKFACFKDFYDYVVNDLKVDPRGLTIDRINNDGHYEKGNIRFVTKAENNQNRKRN